MLDERRRLVEKGIGHIYKRRGLIDKRVGLFRERRLIVRYEFILLRAISLYFFVRIIFESVPIQPGLRKIRLGFVNSRAFGRRSGVIFVILNKGSFRYSGRACPGCLGVKGG